MTLTVRRTLMLAFGAIVVLLTVVLLALSFVQRDRLVRDLAPKLLGSAQSHVHSELDRLFGTIRSRLAVQFRQAEAGRLEPFESGPLTKAMLPEVQHLPSVGSVMLGDTTGYQFLVMRYDSLVTRSPLLAGRTDLPPPSTIAPQYFTREFRASSWGERSVWTLWAPGGERVQQTWEQPMPGYDPRRREWLLRAVARRAELESAGISSGPEAFVAWTDAYTLFTSKTPGISASVAARTPQGDLLIVAYDLLLDDLSGFVRAQRPTERGRVFVFTDSGRVVGLPEAPHLSRESDRLAALLQPLDAIGDAELAAWAAQWRARPSDDSAPFRFKVGSRVFWGGFERFGLGPDRGLWVGVSLPEDDLLATTRHDPVFILLLALLTLLLGIAASSAIAARISGPLTRLVERSQRIGALQLAPEPAPQTPILEVRQLGGTIERMGEALRDHLAALERARAALTESEQRFRSTFEQAAVGMCQVSPEGRFVRVNQRMCDIFGYSREEMMRLDIRDLSHEAEHETDRGRIRDMLEGRMDSGSWEVRCIRRSGEEFACQITTRLLRDAERRPRYFISVVQDVTERRSLEAQLRQSQKLEAVGQLAGGVAHDFNNLLTVVSGHAALARKGLAAHHPATADLEQIEYAAKRASELTRQLLAFARREIVESTVFDPVEMVKSSQRMLRRLIGEHIDLVTRTDGEVGFVRIDRGQLEQVLVNLVVNARDAMPDGGRVTLALRSVDVPAAGHESPEASRAGAFVEIAVTDQGTGMTPEVQARVFEPFFTTKPIGHGTGLGLATCYGIVQQAGGHIRVESAPGEGATFRVRLPALGRESRDMAPVLHPTPVVGGRETILIAEDEPAIRALTERVLRGLGYTVHSAPDGTAALALAERLGTGVDLLVTDVIMPGLRGRDLAARLSNGHARLKVLYVSGYGQDSLTGQVPEGMHFLAKPFGPEALARKVREVLDAAA